ncbi:LysR family transcriptional regulator [Frigoribacterium sp. Leaf172]|uniref:LysR family transcriptional regulator n=1 Tax=Frigoribacterium sp. Leaf172 TaxID=1736285 RepID=UPI0006F903AE|nr:LysR family transcriptional regulator [Frigoribacterium sp. Leaf172]KQR61940.1 LysR family transcriptional regulator [Frigoribacterium sp. Leaf172]
MKTSHLRHFLVAAEVLHFPVAADKLGISRQKLESSIEALELEFGQRLFDRDASPYRLTKAGRAAIEVAEAELASPSTPPAPPAPPAGGKAKASKGKGRTPAVKGQPKPFKKRQGR